MSRALSRGEVCAGELVEIERFSPRDRRFVIDSAAPVRGPDGAVLAGVVASMDVTERIRAEMGLRESEARIRASLDEKSVLLKEIHHRVKNNLQIVSTLLDLQSGQTTDRKSLEMFRESRGRVRSMAPRPARIKLPEKSRLRRGTGCS